MTTELMIKQNYRILVGRDMKEEEYKRVEVALPTHIHLALESYAFKREAMDELREWMKSDPHISREIQIAKGKREEEEEEEPKTIADTFAEENPKMNKVEHHLYVLTHQSIAATSKFDQALMDNYSSHGLHRLRVTYELARKAIKDYCKSFGISEMDRRKCLEYCLTERRRNLNERMMRLYNIEYTGKWEDVQDV